MANTPLRADSACANPIARREMLSAALCASAALALPVSAIAAPSQWQIAMHRFDAARAAETAYDNQVWMPAYQAAEMDANPIADAIDAELNRLTDLRCEAEEQIIAMPSPHLSGVVWKMEYARVRWEDFDSWPDAWWSSILGDMARLNAKQGGC